MKTTKIRNMKLAETATRTNGRKPSTMANGNGSTPLRGEEASTAEAKIRLELDSLNTIKLLDLAHLIHDGLDGNTYYANLSSDVTALGAAQTDLLASLDQLAKCEHQTRMARSVVQRNILTTRETLRTAARHCEGTNNTEEALLSVGWQLRRGRSAPPEMPAPSRLEMTPGLNAGELQVRWRRVANAHFYETQTTTDLPGAVDWVGQAVIPTSRVKETLGGFAPGTPVSVRVRAVGAKGPGPWSEVVTVRAA